MIAGVRPAHLAPDGIIRPVDDPFWNTHSPPAGFRCRCSLISLSEAQARSNGDNGLNKQTTAQPDKGWDYSPRDRMAGVKAAVGNKRSQCAGLFSAIHLAGKNRHNPPIWCSGDGAKKLDIINSAANFNHEMPAPKDIILQIFNKGEDSKFYLTHFMQHTMKVL